MLKGPSSLGFSHFVCMHGSQVTFTLIKNKNTNINVAFATPPPSNIQCNTKYLTNTMQDSLPMIMFLLIYFCWNTHADIREGENV